MIISAYNVANCVAIAPVAFMGTSRNKPVFIGVGVLTVGVGALLFSSVHFIAPAYQWGSEHQDLCPAGELPDEFCLRGDVRNYWFLLMLANAIHGIGSTPFYTLGVSYMDESVPTRTVSTYLGKSLVRLSTTLQFMKERSTGYYSLVEEKNTESHLGEHVMKDASLRQLPGAIYGILSNSTFLSLALAGTADSLPGDERRFPNLENRAIARKRARDTSRERPVSSLIASLVAVACIFALMSGSDPFVFPCNKHCNCHNSVYNPVCSVDGTVFFSPCLAGCEARLAKGGARVYANCSCITQYVPEELPNGTFFNVQGRRQKCNTGCTLLPYFTLGLFLALFSNFLNLAPLSAAVLRVVTPKERSLALAVKKIIMRVFASIPGPMLFGHVIDRSCLVWQSIGGHTGSCLYYNNKLLAHNLFYVLILLKTLSVLLYGLSWIKYRENFRSGRRDWHAA
ncbi:hypothetical protein HPB51_028037 [Rhipicephalus microplus]|uniref:Kazal-like domain-containing protein n=1 Tax=Rhipicephalus microplus TaxID=6941 RepID=A0A9J6CYH7_RHIMP|nr:hypothetical protein HPB51_028037 [Rhipicephalus microplus]